MAFTQPLEHSRRVRACCFSSPHAPGWEAPIPETWDKGWHLLGGWFRVLVMACGGVQEAGRVAGGETRRSEPVAPCCLSWSRTAAFFWGETVPHRVTCLSLFASPWRPWGSGEATAPRGPRPREERGGRRGHDFWLHSAPLPTYGFPPAGSSVFQKFLLVAVTSSSGLDLAELWGLEGRAVPRLGVRGSA